MNLQGSVAGSKEALEPCPFCGKPGEMGYLQQVRMQVGCETLNCMGNGNENSYPSEAEAIAAWNRRAITLPPGEEGELVERCRSEADYLEAQNHPPLCTRVTLRDAADTIEALKEERDAARRVASLGCDANDGGPHSVMKRGSYTFCHKCGETLKQFPLRERARAAESSLAEAQANSAADDLQIKALTRKIEALAPHGTCACSWDAPGETCLHHSPALAEAQLRIAEREEALKPFAGYLDTAHFDLDDKGRPLPDDQGMGWVYLTVGDFRAARRALSETETVVDTTASQK